VGKEAYSADPGNDSACERPLGINPDIELHEHQFETLQALAIYDLTPIRDRLLDQGAMPSAWVDEAIFEFRRYLGLRVIASGSITMFSRQVDDVWHTCLLHSRLYADLCQRSFGHFVHHEPRCNSDGDPSGAWADFERLYRALYGVQPGRLWQMGRPQT
jgi:hypothetical protein